ncbi:MAG: DUF2283 domain-containing protein [Acidobacteria bacterium]|nr:MAG: DUF2283 domain-containing protein [Acidobacteriota bacterium]
MKVTYNVQADALYIQLREGKFVRNREVAEGIIFDMGEGEILLGMEILGASSHLSLGDLARVEMLMPLELAGTSA